MKKGQERKVYLADEIDAMTLHYSLGKEAWQCTMSTNL